MLETLERGTKEENNERTTYRDSLLTDLQALIPLYVFRYTKKERYNIIPSMDVIGPIFKTSVISLSTQSTRCNVELFSTIYSGSCFHIF